MQALYYISQLLGLVAFVTLIWLVVRGFKRSAWWGLGVLFLSPFAATVFGILYWDEEKKPFLIYITSFVLAVTLGLTVFFSWGGLGVLTASKRVHQGIMQQNLTEADAMKFMHANMDFLENTALSEEDQQKLALMRDMVNKMEGGVTEEEFHQINEDALKIMERSELTEEQHRQLQEFREQVEQSRPTASAPTSPAAQPVPASTPDTTASGTETPPAATPEPVAPVKSTLANQAKAEPRQEMDPREIIRRRYRRAPQHRDEYRPIDLAQAKRYINAPVIVTRMDGAEQKATLIDVDGRQLQFEQRLPGGSVTFKYTDYEIKSLQVPRDAH